MNIRVIGDDQNFYKLKNDWDNLAKNLSPINGFDWMYKWWQYFKYNNELKILIAEKSNKIVGIAPLYIENTKTLKVLPYKKLHFLGGNLSDYLDFILDSSCKKEVFEAFFDYILNNISYDLLDLGQINSSYPNFDLWQKYANLHKIHLISYNECPRLNLENYASYDDFYKKLNKNLKGSIKFRQGKARKNGINYNYVFKNTLTEEDIKTIAELNLKRQIFLHNKGDHKRFCYFVDEDKHNFIKDFFCIKDPANKLLCYATHNDTVVAYDLALINNDTILLWSAAFDPDYQAYSPLKLLINELIKYAFNNGFKCVDFLRGKDQYKLEWTDDMSVNYNLTMKKSAKAHLSSLYNSVIPKSILNLLRQPNKEILQNNLTGMRS